MNFLLFNSNPSSNTLFYIEGESNSGGLASISLADPADVGTQPSVKILNLNTLASLDTLQIGGTGSNNLLDHAGAQSYYGLSFGFELEIARRAKTVPFYNGLAYVVKCGQGGSVISQWATGGAYDIKSLDRTNAIKSLLPNSYKTIILYSLGINDSEAGTNVAAFKIAVKNRHAVLRSRWGYQTPIIMTQFNGMGRLSSDFDAFSRAIAEICAETQYTFYTNTFGATINADKFHWNGANTGMKYVTGKLLDIAENL